jgi:hypothetical protein
MDDRAAADGIVMVHVVTRESVDVMALTGVIAAALHAARVEGKEAAERLTDQEIDERIQRYHNAACGFQRIASNLQARVTALEAALRLVKSDLSVLHLGGSVMETIIQIDAALTPVAGGTT